MKSVFNTTCAVLATLVGLMSEAHADLLPEPGSFALTGLGLVAAVYFLRKGRKK